MTSGKALPPEVLDQIVARTDGVPLFIEELTKTVLESGLLREADHRYELTGPLPPLAIPSTLHASLLARLDRLASVKDVAQIGAAIGREFSYALIAAVAALPEKDLKAALGQLVAAELIFQRGVPPDATYQFKHALVQDAAYASLVRSRRQQLHGQIARALEEQFPDTAATEPETLSHHFAEAGLVEPAIDYLLKAGEHALANSAFVEAAKHLTKGAELIQLLPGSPTRDNRELSLQLRLGTALRATKGFAAPETMQVYSRARELLGGGSTLVEQTAVFSGLWRGHHGSAEHIAARQMAEQILAHAARHEHSWVLAHAHRLIGQTLCLSGAFVEARHNLERSLDLSDRHEVITSPDGSDDKVVALAFLSWTLWLLGYPAQSSAAAAQALARARRMGEGHSMVIGMALHGHVRLVGFGADPQQTHTDEMVAHCTKHQLANYEHWALFHRGNLLSLLGDIKQGIEQMRAAMAAENINTRLYRTQHLGLIAAAHARLGQADVCIGLVDEAIQTAERTSERFVEAELHRLRGEMLLKSGKKTEALIELQHALDIARQQEARWWELRAATTLAKHWHDEGRHAEAYNLLEPVYSWFTEGFETADLKTAKELLDQLRV